MIFKDKRYENSFHQILNKMQLSYSDPERTALAYLLALNEDCCNHFNDLYSFEERELVSGAILTFAQFLKTGESR